MSELPKRDSSEEKSSAARLEIDLQEVDGMILSYGRLDHWGGLPGFLQKHRA
jgi:metal-dependent hydrolase (beta-lactamase superfamily II)